MTGNRKVGLKFPEGGLVIALEQDYSSRKADNITRGVHRISVTQHEAAIIADVQLATQKML